MAWRDWRETRRMDARLRGALTAAEYERVARQLEGAIDAITLLEERAPDFLEYFFGAGFDPAVPAQAKAAVQELMRELRAVRAADAAGPTLRLVRRHP